MKVFVLLGSTSPAAKALENQAGKQFLVGEQAPPYQGTTALAHMLRQPADGNPHRLLQTDHPVPIAPPAETRAEPLRWRSSLGSAVSWGRQSMLPASFGRGQSCCRASAPPGALAQGLTYLVTDTRVQSLWRWSGWRFHKAWDIKELQQPSAAGGGLGWTCLPSLRGSRRCQRLALAARPWSPAPTAMAE